MTIFFFFCFLAILTDLFLSAWSHHQSAGETDFMTLCSYYEDDLLGCTEYAEPFLKWEDPVEIVQVNIISDGGMIMYLKFLCASWSKKEL